MCVLCRVYLCVPRTEKDLGKELGVVRTRSHQGQLYGAAFSCVVLLRCSLLFSKNTFTRLSVKGTNWNEMSEDLEPLPWNLYVTVCEGGRLIYVAFLCFFNPGTRRIWNWASRVEWVLMHSYSYVNEALDSLSLALSNILPYTQHPPPYRQMYLLKTQRFSTNLV